MSFKKNIVFIVPYKDKEMSQNMEMLFSGDPNYSFCTVNEKRLRCLWWTFLIDHIIPVNSALRNKLLEIRRSLSKKKEFFTYGNFLGLPQKTVNHLLNRFMPKGILITDPVSLRAVNFALTKRNTKCKVFVLYDSSFAKEDLLANIDQFFVESLDEKIKLISYGINPTKISVDPQSVSANILGTTKFEARKKLGLPKEKKTVLMNLEKGDALLEDAFIQFWEGEKEDANYFFYCGDNEKMASVLTTYQVNIILDKEKDDYFAAADILFTVSDTDLVTKAKEMGKKIILFRTDMTSASYKALTRDFSVKGAESGKEMLKHINSYVKLYENQQGLLEMMANTLREKLEDMDTYGENPAFNEPTIPDVSAEMAEITEKEKTEQNE